MRDTIDEDPRATRRTGLAARLLACGLAEHELDVVGEAPAGDWPLRRAGRTLRERFQAMTDIGLAPPRSDAAPPQRHALPGRAGAPGLSYLGAGDPAGRPVLFIHGTPGAAVDWTPFLQRVPVGQRRLAVDRPGFGQSGPGAPVTALPDQARAIAGLLEAGAGPATVVGSSYGGPVALQIAAAHPELVSGVVLVGAAADPARERTHPVQHLAARPAFGGMLPRPLAHSNAELLALRAELEALGGRLGRIRAPVTILQGVHDTLVPAENAPYLVARLTRAARRRVVLVERAGHFLHVLRSGLVEAALEDQLTAARG